MGVHSKREFNCPVDATISLIGGKYKAVILWHLKGNTLRYSELHRRIPKARRSIQCSTPCAIGARSTWGKAARCIRRSYA